MRRSLRDKTILITGASSGIGRGVALALSRGANRIVVTARRADRLAELAAEIEANGSTCVVGVVDATDREAVARQLEAAIAAVGPIDVALLNVGGSPVHVMGGRNGDAASVVDTMRKNYDALVHYLCPLIDHMRVRGGTIAYTGSPAGMFALPKSGPYSAAKAAGRILMDACRIELAQTPIRFVTLYPGFTDTEGLAAEEVPSPALIIPLERAVDEVLWAIETGRSAHMFPKRIRYAIAVARWLPERWLRAVLRLVG